MLYTITSLASDPMQIPHSSLDPTKDMKLMIEIYNVPMKFARKLIQGGPVHPCYEPVKALHQRMVLSEGMLDRWFYLHG